VVFLITDASLLLAYPVGALLGGPLVGFALSTHLAVFVYAGSSWFFLTPNQEYIRGRKYRSFREIYFLAKFEHRLKRGPSIFFGGIRLPWASAVKHWLILGVTGAGKSMLFELLMKDTLKGRIGLGNDERGLIYDNKTELLPVLSAMGVPWKLVHPFDKRGVAIDFASMVPTHTHSLEVASILMPRAEGVGSDPFWVDSPRNLLASVMTSLRLGLPGPEGTRKPMDWEFRDLVLIMQSQETIREVIVRHPETAADIEGYFDDPRLLANVMATVKTQMMYYRPVAACWHKATERLNLTDAVWGKEEYVLVLGNDEQFRRAIDPINRVVITRYGQLSLKRPKSDTRRIWFYFDEFGDLKKLDPDLVMGLLTKGRSKGISMVLGVQSRPSVVAEYGREIARVIFSQCQNVAILGLGDLDDDTCEYATRVIGQLERFEHRENEQVAASGLKTSTRHSRNQELQSRPVLLSAEFSDLPETVRRNGCSGYYRTRSIRGFWGTVIPGSFLARELVKPNAEVPAVLERDEADHELKPWDERDLARLGLKTAANLVDDLDKRPVKKGLPFRVYRGGRREAAS
jgi:hypothetical protein